MTVHVFFAFPETAGKPLEEVEKIFTNGTPAWKTHVSTKRTIAAERGDIEAKTPVRDWKTRTWQKKWKSPEGTARDPWTRAKRFRTAPAVLRPIPF